MSMYVDTYLLYGSIHTCHVVQNINNGKLVILIFNPSLMLLLLYRGNVWLN